MTVCEQCFLFSTGLFWGFVVFMWGLMLVKNTTLIETKSYEAHNNSAGVQVGRPQRTQNDASAKQKQKQVIHIAATLLHLPAR